MRSILSLFTLFILFSLGTLQAEEPQPCSKQEAHEEVVTTNQIIQINGHELPYEAKAGTLLLKGDKGEPKAKLFYVAYTKEGVEDQSLRPITFCFNGGPGSAAIWLHMGALGPRRIAFTEMGEAEYPYCLEDNPYSLLDVTDLVFIDPVSTGYSRTTEGEDPDQFHDVEEDIASVGEFIRLYVTRNGRWKSPKFIAGESYGTTRAAGLAWHLHDDHNMYLNGILLLSSVLDFQTVLDFHKGNDLAHIVSLPSYTAAAWYHQKLPEDLQRQELRYVLNQAENFALSEYAVALHQGSGLHPQRREKILTQLSRYTGLPRDYLDQANLRVPKYRFDKKLLNDEGQTVGRFDSRFTGRDTDPLREFCEHDPSFDAIFGAFAATFNDYIREELNWKQDEKYEIIADVNRRWKWGNCGKNRYLNVSERLHNVMVRNPLVKVFVASGYYDLATPYFATDYTFNHLGLTPEHQNQVEIYYYEAGHMMYIHRPSLELLKHDLTSFILRAAP